MRSVENAQYGNCVENFNFPFFSQFNKNLTSEQHSVNCSCITLEL